MARFLMNPVKHDEAVQFIQDKPVVFRQAFDRLVPEVQGRVFTITGVRNADTLQRVRDRIADLPAGADWDDVKNDVIREVLPDFVDPNADPEERDRQITAATRRSELLLRTHGFQAYQAASWNAHEQQKDLFPYRRYLTVGDDRVRDSHRALHGMILPVDDPFWDDHYPPWDYGCRCQAVPVSRAAYEIEMGRDADRDEAEKLIPSDTIRNDMRSSGRLVRGGGTFDVTPPKKKTGSGWQWHPRDLRMPVAELQSRYSQEVWQVFERAARKTEIPANKGTLADWLGIPKEDSAPAEDPTAPVRHPDDLLRRRGYSAEDAARALNQHPGYEESVIMRRWARDSKGQRAIAWGNSRADQHQREVYTQIVDRLEPYRSEAPIYRGFKSRFHPVGGEDRVQMIKDTGYYQNDSPGMSAAKEMDVAQRNKFLGREGFLMEIHGHKSARDFEPIARALHPGHANEKEVVFQYGRFRLLEEKEIEIHRGPQHWTVPLLVVEEMS